MLRGVEFIGEAEDLFMNLESVMEILGHDWCADDIYTYMNEFREGKYSGQELKNALPELAEQVFVRLRRYPEGSAIDQIDTYEEYLESPSDVIILFYDGGYCQIYAKDEEITHRLYKLAARHEFEDIEYVYDENDGRTGMHF